MARSLIAILLLCLAAISCTPAGDDMDVSKSVVVEVPKVYFQGRIGNFNVKLHDVGSQCILSYSTYSVANRENTRELDIQMTSPCNFIRIGYGEQKPLSYTYQTGIKQRTVLLVTGGAPDSDAKDEFQPEGCGTWLARIYVFSDRIEVASSGWNGPPFCPSMGAEEVFFAT